MNEININEMESVAAVNRDYSKLPKALAASIHIDGNKGKKSDGEYTASAFIITVKAVNPKTGNVEWRPENEWLHMAGMKTVRRVYADGIVKGGLVKGIDKARKAKEVILAKWHMETEKKTPKAKGPTKAELAAQNAELAAKLAALEAKLAAA